MIVIAIILVFCTGVCACCVAARDSIRSNPTAAEVNVNVASATEMSAPSPSYSQSTDVIQQQSSAYSAPDTDKTAAPVIIKCIDPPREAQCRLL